MCIVRIFYGYKIFFKDAYYVPNYYWLYPSVDIFIAKLMKNDKVGFKCKGAQQRWSNCQYNIKKMYPLKRYKFGSFDLMGVSADNIDEYLSGSYGESWATHGYQQYDHLNEKFLKQIKVQLTDDAKKPAQPINIDEITIDKMNEFSNK